MRLRARSRNSGGRPLLRPLWTVLVLAGCAPAPGTAPPSAPPFLLPVLTFAADADAARPRQAEARLIESTRVAFAPSDSLFPNPERGLYRRVDLVPDVRASDPRGPSDLGLVPAAGLSLAHSYVRLDEFRERPLPPRLLADLAAGLGRARDAGIKVILRFAYNHGPIGAPDAPYPWVLHHIEQLRPVLERNVDVIALVEAGFIGAWGEWHSSTHGLIDDRERWVPQTTEISSPAPRLLAALLLALPPSRMVALRYPSLKGRYYGAPLGPEDAFDGTPRSRIGHHNDCFASTATDMGTYTAEDVETWKSYLERDNRWVVMGGEGCHLGPGQPESEAVLRSGRSNCATAVAEMRRLHFSYYNSEFPAEFDAAPCLEELQRRLGYRIQLESAEFPGSARPGDRFVFEVRLRNVGWAAPFNPRPVRLVLRRQGGVPRVATLPADPRRWQPGEEIVLSGIVELPCDLGQGRLGLGLWLPDASPTLEERREYALRFANDAGWDASVGINVLGSIEIASEGTSRCEGSGTM